MYFFLSVFLSSLLFFLSQPNFLLNHGLPLLAWFCYVPVFLYVRFSSKVLSSLAGGVFGFLSFFLFGLWLLKYNVAAAFAVFFLYAILFSALFFVLKKCEFSEKFCILLKTSAFLFVEFLRTQGPLGLSYGVTGYSQWTVVPLVKTASIWGVWGISFIIVFFNVLVSESVFQVCFQKKKLSCEKIYYSVFFAAALIFSIVYGSLTSFPTGDKSSNFLLVQNNSNPKASGIEAYKKETQDLIRITANALASHPETDFVVWPETAVVPDILYHYSSNADEQRHELVMNLLEFIDSTECVFIIGNNYGKVEDGKLFSYNSVLVFSGKKNVFPPEPEIYSKIHLVPFSECVPFSNIFPPLKKLALKNSSLWDAGKEFKVFNEKGLKFSTPICFEDTFPSVVRRMKKNGADLIVNLTNDSWSKSLACQYQHLSMAVFRAAENKIPAVRSTCSGQTCVISAEGKVLAMIPPFSEGFLFFNVNHR